jgi:hypothetical protein
MNVRASLVNMEPPVLMASTVTIVTVRRGGVEPTVISRLIIVSPRPQSVKVGIVTT